MKIRTENRTLTLGVHGPHAIELCADDNNGVEVGVLLTPAEAFQIAGALIAMAEEASFQGARAEANKEMPF